MSTPLENGTGSSRPNALKQASYVPQFATSTSSLILNRLKRARESHDGAPSPEASQPVQSLSDTLPIPQHMTLETQSSATSEAPEPFQSGAAKRKRDSPGGQADFSQSTVAFPWVDGLQSTASSPLVPPRDHQGPTCARCEGSLQTAENRIVRCDGCLKSWHQQCHAPVIPSAREAKSFSCTSCAAELEQVAASLGGKASLQRRDETERLRRKRIATFPQNVVPAKPALVGFGPGRAPNSSRTEYFASKNKTDLLNVLSLCDQLKPQLLADVLVSVSQKHPDLPIFDSPDWESQLASAHRPTTTTKPTTTAEKHPRSGHIVVLTRPKVKAKATKKILKRTRVIEVITDVPGVNEDVLPATWMRADEGMYAKLVADVEDGSLLVDENDEESFSHFMVDGFGKQVTEAVG